MARPRGGARAALAAVMACGAALPAWSAAAEAMGHYDPATVAGLSAVFNEVSSAMQPRFEEAQGRASATAAALREFELALDALGPLRPTEQVARYQALRRDYVRQRRVLEAAVQEVAEDFDAAFQAAVRRALPHPGVEVCAQPSGPLARLRAPSAPCPGPDQSAAIASRLDADPTLRAQLDAIAARGWPALDLDLAPVPAVGAPGSAWIALGALLGDRAAEALRRIDADDEAARADIDAAIEEGADADELRALREDAARIDADTASRRAALAADLIAAVDALNARRARQGDRAFAWCAQPTALGGCEGASAGADDLATDKRVARALDDLANAAP
jgi:hypothetical protein